MGDAKTIEGSGEYNSMYSIPNYQICALQSYLKSNIECTVSQTIKFLDSKSDLKSTVDCTYIHQMFASKCDLKSNIECTVSPTYLI